MSFHERPLTWFVRWPSQWVMSDAESNQRKRNRLAVGSSCQTLSGFHDATSTLTDPAACRARRQHLPEHLHRLLHFFHRSERDAAVRLLERRKISSDRHLERSARLAELACGSLQVDEDAVGVAVGRLVSHALERLEREVTHAGIFGALFFDVLRIPERRDSGCGSQRVDAAEAPGTGDRLDGLGLANGVA